MDERSICAPQLAESDAENKTISSPNAASVTDADKVINTNVNVSQIEGDLDEEELLKGLLTDDYCHVCEAVLLFESQRLSHYEGKKHAHKLRLYLQTKRDEKTKKNTGGLQRGMAVDKERFCELCNMVFSSPVVARSHYEGKVHAKNLRKQGLYPTYQPNSSTDTLSIKGPELPTLPELTHALAAADQKSAREVESELQDPTATSTNTIPEVDLKDPYKYCTLCVASFNNPQMAQQHYNGRKHQRNQARQQLLKDLGEDGLEANSLICPICSVKFNSVEMYQAHMQGNKHQMKEQKVANLCKSQQKVYNSFTDELADYIQVQKARGLAPKTSLGLAQDDGEEEDEEEVDNKEDGLEPNRPILPPTSTLPLPPHPGSYCPPAAWCPPPYQGPPGSYSFRGWSHSWGYGVPSQPLHPGAGSPQFTGRPRARRRRRERSSSSSYTSSSSSSSSSYSSSTSDSSESDYRHRERRRKTSRRSRREEGRRVRGKDSDEEDRRRRQTKRARDEGSEERKGREELAESGDERRRKRRRKHGKSGRREKKRSRGEELEEEGGREVVKEEKAEDMAENREGTEVHTQAEVTAEQEERELSESSKPKQRKEKKKTKEKVDTRTEEEKLWDESILGL